MTSNNKELLIQARHFITIPKIKQLSTTLMYTWNWLKVQSSDWSSSSLNSSLFPMFGKWIVPSKSRMAVTNAPTLRWRLAAAPSSPRPSSASAPAKGALQRENRVTPTTERNAYTPIPSWRLWITRLGGVCLLRIVARHQGAKERAKYTSL